MTELRYTLLADGSSDQALMRIITWALREQGVSCAIQAAWADLGRLRQRPRHLVERIKMALMLYPCDLLCIHRDAEREPHAVRYAEIVRALEEVTQVEPALPVAVAIVPVRMHEAWLLIDEDAIRIAAGNPRGRQPLALPQLAEIEGLADPKELLHTLIRTASGQRGRRLQRLDMSTQRVADLIDDFTPLRRLSAFQSFEQELARVVDIGGWRDQISPPTTDTATRR